VQVGQAAMADRYSYIPGIGLTFALVYFISELVSKKRSLQIFTGILSAAVIVAMVITSLKQISYWKNNVDLMTHSNAVIPDDFLAKSSLSMDDTASGKIADAIALAKSAVDLVPGNQEAHHALAKALVADNQPGPALKEYVTAIHLDPQHPGLRVELGWLLARQNRLADAVKQFQKAVDLDPDYIEARHCLAGAFEAQGKDAIAQWEIVVEQDPSYGPSQGSLADALRHHGDHTGAIQHYQAALADGETNPNWKANLAWEMAIDPATTSRQLQSIVSIAKQACDQTHNQLPFPLYAYSLVLARLGEFNDAIDAANMALHLAESTHQTQMANAIRARIQAYQNGQIVNKP
jgi:tetratricopeptide (TPR) repeat protein